MDAPIKMHLTDEQFAGYIKELQECSATNRVPFGHPADLKQLLDTLKSSTSFAADFGSMIRSIVLREHFQVPESELLTLVAVAWGGEHAEDLTGDLAGQLAELRSMLQELLRRGAMGSLEVHRAPAAPPEPAEENAPDVVETLRELEQLSPDVQMYRQLLKFQGDSSDVQPEVERQDTTPRDVPSEQPATLLSEPTVAEILTAGLIGFALALLLVVGSLPVYRSRVSVKLPSSLSESASIPAALRSGAFSRRVADQLLAEPNPVRLLKQDALSRAMRDLHLGGNEPILYADLVSDTARRVKITPVAAQDVYEITCESWSAQFAATFCNQVLDLLHREPVNGISAQASAASIQTIDAAVAPGVQISPHWFLQSVLGFACGCVAGVLLWFMKRSNQQHGLGEETSRPQTTH